MKSIQICFFFVFFTTIANAQSLGDIHHNLDRIDKSGYMKSLKKLLTRIAEDKSFMRGEYADRMADKAEDTKYSLQKAYDKTYAYRNKVRSETYYSEVASIISSLQNYLQTSIDNCQTIKYYSSKIAANYKSKKNGNYYYKIQSAYNSLTKNRKKARDKVFELVSKESAANYYKSQKKVKEKQEQTIPKKKSYSGTNLEQIDVLLKAHYPYGHKKTYIKGDTIYHENENGKRRIRLRDIDINSIAVVRKNNISTVNIKSKYSEKKMIADWGTYDNFGFDVNNKTAGEEIAQRFKLLLKNLGYH